MFVCACQYSHIHIHSVNSFGKQKSNKDCEHSRGGLIQNKAGHQSQHFIVTTNALGKWKAKADEHENVMLIAVSSGYSSLSFPFEYISVYSASLYTSLY